MTKEAARPPTFGRMGGIPGIEDNEVGDHGIRGELPTSDDERRLLLASVALHRETYPDHRQFTILQDRDRRGFDWLAEADCHSLLYARTESGTSRSSVCVCLDCLNAFVTAQTERHLRSATSV